MWICYLLTHTKNSCLMCSHGPPCKRWGQATLFSVSLPLCLGSGLVLCVFSSEKHVQTCRIKICQHGPSVFLETTQMYFIRLQNANWNLLISRFWPPVALYHSCLIDTWCRLKVLLDLRLRHLQSPPRISDTLGRQKHWGTNFHTMVKETLEPQEKWNKIMKIHLFISVSRDSNDVQKFPKQFSCSTAP